MGYTALISFIGFIRLLVRTVSSVWKNKRNSQRDPFSVEELKIQSDKAAEALNVPIYGGDCVVSADGTLRIIDFNDWPSFARCREEAGGKIAECIYNRAKKQMKQ